jgi:mRNA-degrading endonuclease RelE of RelBE toxin-antitoxin system
MPDNTAKLVRVEFTPEFKRNIRQLAKKYRHLQADVQPVITQLEDGATPGTQIPRTGYTVFKARIKNSDIQKGKRSGYRMVYYLKTPELVLLITIYSKTEQDDAFPAITLIIAVFFVLRALHLLNTLAGVMLVKVALELPFALWVMKGFFDGIPWPVEMAALVDGANRFTTWYRILLLQIRPGITALSLFAFLSGWGGVRILADVSPGEKRLDAVTLRGQHPGRRRSVCRLRIDDGSRAVLYVSGPTPLRCSP